jgi:hypothetical protein
MSVSDTLFHPFSGVSDAADPQVDRRRWKFDEDGFAKGTDAATLRAMQLMQEKILSIHQDIINASHAADYHVTVDGVPIEKVNFEK